MMIQADDISVVFNRGFFKPKVRALDRFSLTVREGDIFALIGPNGAGKSTAMYCFLGLVRPDSGSISVLGRKPEPGSSLFRDIAYLPEEPHYHQYLTVREAVDYYARLNGNGADRKAVDTAIERVGMAEFRDHRVSKCSKGMKQKVGIAQSLVNNPKLMFLDEPTRGLDPVMVKEFRNILTEMNRNGTTIVLNSHVLSEIEMICNRAAVINRGKVAVQDEMSSLRGNAPGAYQVECDLLESLPAYLQVTVRTASTIKGEIPAEKLQDFVREVEGSGSRIYECSIKCRTLEDALFSVLKGAS